MLDTNKTITVDSDLLLAAIEEQIGNNTAELELSEEYTFVSITPPKELNLPPLSKINVLFITNNSYESIDDPDSETGEYLAWEFYDFELDYIEAVLTSASDVKDIKLSTSDTYNFSDSVKTLLNNANCVDFLACEDSDLVTYYGDKNPLIGR